MMLQSRCHEHLQRICLVVFVAMVVLRRCIPRPWPVGLPPQSQVSIYTRECVSGRDQEERAAVKKAA